MTTLAPLAAAGAASSFMAWAVRGRSAPVFGPSVWRGPRDRRALALTFDDGPSETTPQILEILAATASRPPSSNAAPTSSACPRSPAQSPAGHEIGNHSYTHPLPLPALARRHRRGTRAARRKPSPSTPASAPAGSARPSECAGSDCAAAQQQLRLTGVMWTAIGYDWKSEGG